MAKYSASRALSCEASTKAIATAIGTSVGSTTRGKRRSKCARTTDKATAEQIGDKLETEAAKRREGLIDPQLEGFAREARRPLAELVTEYKAKLVANWPHRAVHRRGRRLHRADRRGRGHCNRGGLHGRARWPTTRPT